MNRYSNDDEEITIKLIEADVQNTTEKKGKSRKHKKSNSSNLESY